MNFNIGKFKINSNRTFIIAEIGNNHNGSFELAINMINNAKDAGADCVKFQMRKINEVYRKRSLKKMGEDLGTEYLLDLLNKFELNEEEHQKLFNYCLQKKIPYLCTPWDKKSLSILEDFGVLAYKVASADLTNLGLIENIIQTNKPIILSTGRESSIS